VPVDTVGCCTAVADTGLATADTAVIEVMALSAKAGVLVIRAPAAAMVTRPAAALSFFRTSSPLPELARDP
jgi:hypothetical protein